MGVTFSSSDRKPAFRRRWHTAHLRSPLPAYFSMVHPAIIFVGILLRLLLLLLLLSTALFGAKRPFAIPSCACYSRCPPSSSGRSVVFFTPEGLLADTFAARETDRNGGGGSPQKSSTLLEHVADGFSDPARLARVVHPLPVPPSHGPVLLELHRRFHFSDDLRGTNLRRGRSG